MCVFVYFFVLLLKQFTSDSQILELYVDSKKTVVCVSEIKFVHRLSIVWFQVKYVKNVTNAWDA